LEEEARQRPASPGAYNTKSTGTWTGSLTSALGVVGSYIPFSGMLSTPTGSAPIVTSSSGKGEGYWNRSVDELVESCNGVPPLFSELRKVILEECITTEGIFRRTPGVSQDIRREAKLTSSLIYDRSLWISSICHLIHSQPCHGGISPFQTRSYRPRSSRDS